MTFRGKIDKDRLRVMWHEGITSRAIGEVFGVRLPAVTAAARKLGLPRRPCGRTKDRVSDLDAVGAAPRPEPARRLGYTDIAQRATDEGLTLTQAMQRFHSERGARR